MKQRNEERGTGSRFLSGVLVLSLSTVLVKLIGLAYKIPMIAYLGAEGMGYFNSAVEIYAMLCVIATAGLPVALSMLISAGRERGDLGGIRRLDRVATALFFLLGAGGSVAMWLFSEELAALIENENAVFCLLAIAPAVMLVCIASAVRGYFQGFHRMAPTALSQLLEALGKLVLGILFADLALKRGYETPVVAAYAVLGLTAGTLISALYLLIHKLLFDRRSEGRAPVTVGRAGGQGGELATLLRIALPITVGSAVMSVTRLSDMALIMRRLQDVGMDVAQANVIYGSYTTLAVPVFSLIPSLITPVSLVSVPQLSAAVARGSAEEQTAVTDRSLRLTVLLSMPSAMGIAVYARPILSLLFASQTEAVAIAAPLLAALGCSILFSGLITTTNALLQAYGRTGIPILSMGVGAAVKVVSAYVLIGIPSVGVMGAPISTLLCNGVVTVINLAFLGRCVPQGQGEGVFLTYWKPFLASVTAILASLAAYLPVDRYTGRSSLAFVAAVAVAVVTYGVGLILFRCVTEEDLALLPKGEWLLRRLGKRNS